MTIFDQANPLASILKRPDQSILPVPTTSRTPGPTIPVPPSQTSYDQTIAASQVPVRKTEAGKLDDTMVSSVMGVTGSEVPSKPLTTLEAIVERGKRLQKGIARYDE
jgi:hypothetical protein